MFHVEQFAESGLFLKNLSDRSTES